MPGDESREPREEFLHSLAEEHCVLLKAAGYSDRRRQGSVHKYSSYLVKIVLAAEFASRDELFEPDAWARAAKACVDMASAAAESNTASLDKLYKNYMRGFTTFVSLAQSDGNAPGAL